MFNVAAVRTKAPAVPVALARFLSVKIYYRKKDGDFCSVNACIFLWHIAIYAQDDKSVNIYM